MKCFLIELEFLKRLGVCDKDNQNRYFRNEKLLCFWENIKAFHFALKGLKFGGFSGM